MRSPCLLPRLHSHYRWNAQTPSSSSPPFIPRAAHPPTTTIIPPPAIHLSLAIILIHARGQVA
ncbi:hypothetical protein E2C01_055427 [Portunus trituberculatus]|uniref:Uncharacterized protein n=1 Tax=Portunus trituberculatus TaxID=210409 RepID=A0A5B7GVX1_PORTR|nr:hypothetical protein [Portunus trituberculatus]